VCAFHEAAVKGFRNTVVLRRIRSGEATLSALLLKVSSELDTCELTTAIGTESFNAHAMLCLCPCRKRFISLKGIILCAEDFKPGIMSMIISKSDVVLMSSQAESG